MLKKTITYTDFDGNERTEDFYFNLTKAEVTEMLMGFNGGMKTLLERIIAEQDGKQLVEHFKMMILKSYGRKSIDGKKFEKSAEITNDFVSTNAYSELFMELATNAGAAVAFTNGIIPQNVNVESNPAKPTTGPVALPPQPQG